jgi:hypothetical protein
MLQFSKIQNLNWAFASFLALSAFFPLVQATIPSSCPEPSQTTGYLGNLGTTSGNCEILPLPPLDAFGSLSVNQNAPLQQVNRLNPNQLPTTNNFQTFQNPCCIFPTVWEATGTFAVSAGAGSNLMRCGPFMVAMTQVGPAVQAPQYNFNNGVNFVTPTTGVGFPNLVTNPQGTIFFSSVQTNSTTSYFDVSTNIVNAQTCLVTYTPPPTISGDIIDYNVIGNIFHDVYYNGMTPALATSNPIVSDGTGVILTVSTDGITQGPLQSVPFGSTITGKAFQFFTVRNTGLGVSSYILYAVDSGDNGITLKVSMYRTDPFFFTALTPYTGFLRLAALSTNDPTPVVATPPSPPAVWTQGTYFMPENINDASDSSLQPPALCMGRQISSCPIEQTGCCVFPGEPNWWKIVQVDAIAPTGMSFWIQFPTNGVTVPPLTPPPPPPPPSPPPHWAELFTSLSKKVINGPWLNTTGTAQYPTSQAMSIILPVIAMVDPVQAGSWYTDFFNLRTNPSPPPPPPPSPPYTDGSDFSTNFFLVQFDMFMAQNLAAQVQAFQAASRTLPSYTITSPVNNVNVYLAHRLSVPIQADITTTANTIEWTYTLSPHLPAGTPNNTLVCFPFWKYLQGTTPGVVNTMPGPGQPLQNFIYNDTIKGTLYAAECNSASNSVTFLEGGIPPWYSPTIPFGLFIPADLTFTPTQMTALGEALNQIGQQVVPLPYFPENFLDAAYNGGKTCYMLAKTGLYIAYYLKQVTPAMSDAQIKAATQAYIDNAKSCLTAYLVGRTPGSSFFVADQTAGGICVNGAGGDGTYANGPNLQQSVDSGVDFGNYVYNDHHFFAGYFLLAAAMVTEWDILYNSGSLWIDIGVIGADSQLYTIRNMLDFLWRDTHNPFTNNPADNSGIYDPDLPYDRNGFPWEGHSIANGLQYQPNSLGRNQESISEDFNSWLGMNAYANLVLQAAALTGLEILTYQTVADFSLMNLKMTASAGIQWYKNPTYWIGQNLWTTEPTYLKPAIYIGQFTQTTVTNGEVNDSSAQNQTYF